MFKSWLWVFLGAVALAWSMPAQAQNTTSVVAFQGRLLTQGGPLVSDGTYPVRFGLYPAPTEGTALWTEDQVSVSVTSGLFSAALGSVQAFPSDLFSANPSLWLEITADLDNDGFEASETFAPRTPLNAVPVALHAQDAALFGGDPPADFAKKSFVNNKIDDQSAVMATKADAATVDAQQAAQDAAIAGKLDAAASAYVTVQTTNNISANGASLLAAYAAAKALNPNGAGLSASNRAVLLLPPATYDLGTTPLVLDTNFVDVVGISSNPRHQAILGTMGNLNTGLVVQTAGDVNLQNLYLYCAPPASEAVEDSEFVAAYFPDSDLSASAMTNCIMEHNNYAVGMRLGITYSGTFVDCICTSGGFGLRGTASGTFIRCTAGYLGFGGGGTASGTFRQCTAGTDSFGSNSISTAGNNTNAKMYDCVITSSMRGEFLGRAERCRFESGNLKLGATGRLYDCTVLANLDFNNTTGVAVNCRIKQAIQNAGSALANSGNVTGTYVD